MKNTLKRLLKAGSRRERWLAMMILALSLTVAANAYVLWITMKQGEEFAVRATACEIERFTRTPLQLRPGPGLTL